MRPWPALFAAAILFAVIDAALFGTPLYRDLLDPVSSAGSFEAAAAKLRAWQSDPRRDVLVLGDSRIYSALDPRIADRAAPGLRFLDAGVPGTTPRCWYVFLHAVDPHANRFRALVIPVDTYADDDSAIGSIDGDERVADLHFIVLSLRPRDIPVIAGAFADPRMRLTTAVDLLLRGPILRDDLQAFAANPIERFDAIKAAQTQDAYDPQGAHPRAESLAGLRVNFRTGRITYPSGVSASERHEMVLAMLRPVRPSPSYARYRREWLGRIAARYAAGGVKVIFVRIPTRPVHRDGPSVPSGSLLAIARSDGAQFLPSAPYVALEQPALFADHDHLNRAGSKLFSQLLGSEVARALTSAASDEPPRTADLTRRGDLPEVPHDLRYAVGIGIPLQFQSYEFWVFLAVVATLFYCLPFGLRRYLLLAASYYFYARWNGWYVIFLLLLTISDFAIALVLQRTAAKPRRWLLAGGISANLAFLGTFKYANFASTTVAALAGMQQNPWLVHLFVPIGISFHTFQSISYLVDVYRGKTPAIRDPFDYALYLSFFPQLLSGPIVRAGLFFGELFHWRAPSASDVSYGLMRAAFGLFKKIAIADQFASISDGYFGSLAGHAGAPAAWSALFAFSMQIYFDFSGYSDIAIGCARLFGFVFPENFNLPYLATSVGDFWHRWHMTLSTWLRDYLYVPLGGNRHGLAQTLRNLMITMLLGGLWHGAQWTFVAWGGVHGLLLSVERIFRIRAGDASSGALRYVRVALTFTAVTLAWVLFRAPSFATAIAVYHALFLGGSGDWLLIGWPGVLALALLIFAAGRIAFARRVPDIRWIRMPAPLQTCALAVLLLAIELLSWPGSAVTFIYFKF
ncbi:MAG: MBOAT family protein [Candidatus Eremiobacteraeota bacterium]|nr:MBOAT family protein [Candidatus Eremiobacteraeota bacterium]